MKYKKMSDENLKRKQNILESLNIEKEVILQKKKELEELRDTLQLIRETEVDDTENTEEFKKQLIDCRKAYVEAVSDYNNSLKAIEKLSYVHRQIIIKHYLENKQFEEIGKEINYSPMHVARMHKEALKQLEV